MRAIMIVLVTAVALTASEPITKNITYFGKDSLGKLPPSWKADKTGTGEGSVWKVVADDTAPSKKGHVLAQTAESGNIFNVCVDQSRKLKDLEVSVQFKSVKGEIDQGGGIVWRYQDSKNYYVARMNPLEDNYRVYKIVDGKRIQLESAGKIKVAAGTWHVLKIKHVGSKIECWLDGKKYLDTDDNAIAAEGYMGLWTKADAQTYFDLFTTSNVPADKK